ncbi:MAG: zinc-dependent metalloprotease family protein [Candidatus Aminicenantes bacterium]|nr:zinc-dependent metalloprotease family protein [Candidatus Aminicenantes bacterium]
MPRTSFFSMKKIHLILEIVLIAGLAFVSFANGQAKGRPPGSGDPKWVPLFTVAGIERAGADPIAPQASRYRSVLINPLVSEAGGLAVGDRLFISPFEDGAALGTIDRVETDVNGVLAVRARIQGADGYLLLSSDKGRSLGRLVLPERREYEISCVGGGTTHIIQEFAPGSRIALDDGPPLIPPATALSGSVLPPLGVESPAAANTRIDVMIPYTPAARDHANAGSGINNFINLAMQLGQLGMDNSLVEITLRLVYSALIDYTESGSSYTDLDRLTNTADGYMDQVHTWRNTYGADLVHLLTKVEDVGGLGWLLNTVAGSPSYAFSLGRIQQISWGYTTVHELGHNMGCGHRKGQPGETWNGLFSYAAGWRWVGNDSAKYCSIMSYTDDWDGVKPTQVGYFSNPSVLYKGTPTGNAVDGDNVRSLREIKTVISNYRADSGTNTLTITAGAGGTTNPVPGIYAFATGSILQITAQPNANYRFLSWSGSDTGSQSWIIITLDRDKSLAAAFQRIIYAPTNAAGQKVLNRSLSQSEYINIITFAANSNNANILSYKIYQVENGQKTEVASLDATTFTYWHRGVVGTKEYTYHIVAVNSEPREGDAAVIVIH